MWRNIQSNGLSKKYNDDEVFRINVKKLIALAFVPLCDVINGFELVAGDLEDDAEEFLDYFEKTWVGEPQKRGKSKDYYLCTFQHFNLFLGVGRKKPLFDHKIWNIHDRVITNLPRSNNSVEGWLIVYLVYK